MLLISSVELFHSLTNAGAFQDTFLPLLLKSLGCNVPKIQTIAVQKVPFLQKNIEYSSFKTQILPQLLKIIQETQDTGLKLKCLEMLIVILPTLDKNYLWDTVIGALELVRSSNPDTEINMRLLTLYDKLAAVLSPEDIG